MKKTISLVLTLIITSAFLPVVPASASVDTAYLGSDIKASQKGVTITEYSPISGSFKMAGESYSYGISCRNFGATATYINGGQYTMLSGIYGPLDGSGNSGSCTIAVLGDGKLLTQLTANAGDMPKPFSVEVIGVQELTISFTPSYDYEFALADAVLTVGTPAQTPEPHSPELEATAYLGQDIRAYQKSNMSMSEYPDSGSFKMAGISYYRGISSGASMMTNNSAAAYFNIEGRYSLLSGLYGPVDYPLSLKDSQTIVIIGDGDFLSKFDVRSEDAPKLFSVDVTGVRQLIISFSDGPFALADAVLTKSETYIITATAGTGGTVTQNHCKGIAQ